MPAEWEPMAATWLGCCFKIGKICGGPTTKKCAMRFLWLRALLHAISVAL